MDFEFPFDIKEVCSLINITIRHTSGNSIYVDCPVCSVKKKGKMNINFSKNNFRCNRCNESGGMLDLYIIFGNACLNRSEARAEIIEKLNRNDSLSSHNVFLNKMVAKPVVNSELASIKDIDYTYRALISLLSLSDFHANTLLCRGLTEEHIVKHNFRSVPNPSYFNQIIRRMISMNCTINGVPGFYESENGDWMMNFSKYSAGILVPAVGLDGYIHALQIRLDKPFDDGTKYIWFSSVSKNQGVSSGSPINFAGNPYSDVIYITEGGLKATIAHCLSGKTFLGNQGANQLNALENALKVIKNNGAKIIVIAYDNDKYDKIEVNKGYAKAINMIRNFGFQLELINWDKKYKGIDDFLLAQKMIKGQNSLLGNSA